MRNHYEEMDTPANCALSVKVAKLFKAMKKQQINNYIPAHLGKISD